MPLELVVAACATLILDAATIFMAFVIFWICGNRSHPACFTAVQTALDKLVTWDKREHV